MTATKTRKPLTEAKEEKAPVLLTELTEKAVLTALGKPSDFHSIGVHRHDSSRCRVNVRRAMNKEAATAYFRANGVEKAEAEKMIDQIDHTIARTIVLITDSFYLRTNFDGSLRSDNKPIERKYK